MKIKVRKHENTQPLLWVRGNNAKFSNNNASDYLDSSVFEKMHGLTLKEP